VRVISRRALVDFWSVHSQAQPPLAAWLRLIECSDFTDFIALKRTFGAVDYFAPHTIFDVGGNRFRIVTAIHYNRRRVYVRHVFTHAEYDRWSDRMRALGRSKR
jgi:mRNA interferase HigB